MTRTPPRLALAAAALVWLAAPPGLAQSYTQLQQVAQAAQGDAIQSQKKIDKLADQTRSLLADFRAESRQVDSLRVYTEQLGKLVQAQRDEMEQIRGEIDGVTTVEREIMPLMSRMIDTLDEFVAADLPFLLEERTERVAKLRDLLLRSDVTVAEKYRRLMEAFQIENEFGHTIEAYRGTFGEGENQRQVDFLRIGRVALLYQTLDGDESGIWDGSQYAPLDSGLNGDVKRGLKIARKQASPGLLLVPVATAAGGGSE